MIGKPKWFRRRKYTGWGFTPVTWQGWVYVFIIVFPAIMLSYFHVVSQGWIVAFVVWIVVFCLDFVDIMIHLPKDERDRLHEAIAERNALWMIMAVLAIGVGYQIASGAVLGVSKVDPIIIIAIF